MGAHIVHLSARGRASDEVVGAAERLLNAEPEFRNRGQVHLALAVINLDRGNLDNAQKLVDDAVATARNDEERALARCAQCELALARRDRDLMASALGELTALGKGFFGLNAIGESAAIHLAIAAPGALSVPTFPTTLTPVLEGVEHERRALTQLTAGNTGQAIETMTLAAEVWARHGLERFARRSLLGAAEIALGVDDFDRAESLGQSLVERRPAMFDVTTRRLEALYRQIATRRATMALTSREIEVLRLVAHGMTSREVAQELGIGVTTVDTHITNAMRRLGCHTRRQAALLVG